MGLIVGLTGGIASGKSTVSQFLAAQGLPLSTPIYSAESSWRRTSLPSP